MSISWKATRKIISGGRKASFVSNLVKGSGTLCDVVTSESNYGYPHRSESRALRLDWRKAGKSMALELEKWATMRDEHHSTEIKSSNFEVKSKKGKVFRIAAEKKDRYSVIRIESSPDSRDKKPVACEIRI